MDMSSRPKFRHALKALSLCAAFALTLISVPQAKAQLPAAVTYGARFALTAPTGVSGSAGKVARDAYGDIFAVYGAYPTATVLEFPVNGPAQIVVPSTDPSLNDSNAGFTARLAVDPAGNIFISQFTYSFAGVLYEIARNSNGTYASGVVVGTSLAEPINGIGDIAADSSDNIYFANGTKILSVQTNISNTSGTGARTVLTGLPNSVYAVQVDAAGDLFYTDKTAIYEVTAASLASGSATSVTIGSTTCTGCTNPTTPEFLFFDPVGNLYVGNGSTFFVLPNSSSGFSASTPIYQLPGTVTGHTQGGPGAANNSGLYLPYNGPVEFYGVGSEINTTEAVGASSATSTPSGASLGILFTQATTVGSYVVANSTAAYGGAGTAEISLNAASGSTTCTATSYTVGATCTYEVGYTSRYPGAAKGVFEVLGSSGSILAASNLYFVATGPILALDSVAPTTIGTGYTNPAGVAIDGSGNTYVADATANAVLEYTSGSTAAGTSLGTGLSHPNGVAVDQAGNLYIADTGNNRIVAIPNSSTGLVSASQSTVSLGSFTLSAPRGVSVDNIGNLVISDTGNGRILQVANPFALGSAGPLVLASGLTSPYAVAFDAYNGLYIADYGANKVYQVAGSMLTQSATANVGSGVLVSVGSGLSAPTGVAVDASGSVYIADGGNSRIVKVPSISGVLTTSSQSVIYPVTGNYVFSLNKPFGIATDATNDLYFTDYSAPGVYLALRSSSNAGKTGFLNFGSVAVNGSTSLTGVVSNAGLTTSLAFSAIASPGAPVTLGTASTAPCTATTSLTPGSICNLLLTYAPTATGATAASFNITDNQNNGTTQNEGIHFEGYASGAVASVTINGATSVVYGDGATYTVTALDSNSSPSAAANGTYTVNITGTATKTASVTLSGGTGTFILPSLGVGSYTLATTISGFSPTASVSITKAPLIFSATSFSRIFDVANPTLTGTYSGFGNGDTSAVVTGTPTVATTATRLSPAGTYPITVSGTLTAANYTITEVNGTLTVGGAAPQTILFPALPAFTHGTSVVLTGTSTSGLPLTYTATNGTISGSVLTITAAGATTVTAAQAGNGNYAAATPVTRTFTAQ